MQGWGQGLLAYSKAWVKGGSGALWAGATAELSDTFISPPEATLDKQKPGLWDWRDLGHSSQRSILSDQLQLAWPWTLSARPLPFCSLRVRGEKCLDWPCF